MRLPALLLLLLLTPAGGALEPMDFADESLRQRYQHLTAELRCPKCSNQSLRDSDAPVAADLRRAIHRLLHEGRSDGEILDFMVERYGEFIRYRPRFSAAFLLWLAPLLLGGAGLLLVLRRQLRQRRSAPAAGNQEIAGQRQDPDAQEQCQSPVLAPQEDPPADEKTAAAQAGGRGLPRIGMHLFSPRVQLGMLLLLAMLGTLALYESLGARQDWQLARQLEGTPDWAALTPLLENLHEAEPERREYTALLARSRFETGQYQAAAALYTALGERRPKEQIWHLRAAVARARAHAAATQQN